MITNTDVQSITRENMGMEMELSNMEFSVFYRGKPNYFPSIEFTLISFLISFISHLASVLLSRIWLITIHSASSWLVAWLYITERCLCWDNNQFCNHIPYHYHRMHIKCTSTVLSPWVSYDNKYCRFISSYCELHPIQFNSKTIYGREVWITLMSSSW